MEILFIAPDMALISEALSSAESTKEFDNNVKELISDFEKSSVAAANSPANLRGTWARMAKSDADIDFFSSLALLSANNSYTVSTRDIVMTKASVFVNLNLLETYNSISRSSDEANTPMELNLAGKMKEDNFKRFADSLFEKDTAKFHTLFGSESKEIEMMLLSASFTNDTWSIFESLGPVIRKGVVSQSNNSPENRYPGICILFGLSLSALAQVVEISNTFPPHIKKDFDMLPREEKRDESTKEEAVKNEAD